MAVGYTLHRTDVHATSWLVGDDGSLASTNSLIQAQSGSFQAVPISPDSSAMAVGDISWTMPEDDTSGLVSTSDALIAILVP